MTAHDDFIATMLPVARKYEGLYGFAAEGLIAINISETNWGAAGSLFGIKGSGTAGSINYRTWENYGAGQEHTVIDDNFAAYATVDDAYADFFRFIQIGRYAAGWAAFEGIGDWRELLHSINKAGYATDPGWADMIIALSATVKRSPAWQEAPKVADGWQVKGKQIVLVNQGVEVLKIGNEAGSFPGRISKNFGGDFLWLRKVDLPNDTSTAAFWSKEEGD